MQEFPPNSRRAEAKPEPRERLEQVTSAEAVRRKKGLGRQFKDTFIGGDPRSAAEYVFFNVMVPAARDALFNSMQSWFEKLIFGDTPPRRNTPPSYSPAGHVAYNRMSQAAPPAPVRGATRYPPMLSRASRARHDFADIVIPSQREANEVIDRLFDLLSRYGSASVADLYELTGIQSNHTDMKWGWTELPGARAARLRDGTYLLELPEPQPLS